MALSHKKKTAGRPPDWPEETDSDAVWEQWTINEVIWEDMINADGLRAWKLMYKVLTMKALAVRSGQKF